jgi:hypothetical protein
VTPRAGRSILAALGVLAFAGVSWLVFRGYLTPEMMVYFLSFKWCF